MSETKEFVKERYAAAAREVAAGGKGSCCSKGKDPISVDLYTLDESGLVPEEALLASLGCGNPVALADLHPGETVLDLGSGGGIDVLLSARRVGPSGKAYGLDMTDDMLNLARANQKRAGVENAEFLKGDIESIPLPDESVDVILSNCVINLSGDKDSVLREAFRVLKPGGRLAVADVVTHRELPADVTRLVDFWTGCVSGALQEDDYLARLRAAGFEDASIQVLREYSLEDVQDFVPEGREAEVSHESLKALSDALFSGFVRASKPVQPPAALFVCVHNSGRSQMAEAFFNESAPAPLKAASAGTMPGDGLNASTVEVMREAGIDLTARGHRPKLVSPGMAGPNTRVITMGCGVDSSACPAQWMVSEDWGLDDPAASSLEETRRIRDEIRDRVEVLIRELQAQ